MLCQSCGQRAATTHIKSMVNGQLTETHLCAQCAKKQGYGHILGDWGGFGSLLGGLLREVPAAEVKRCPGCGASFGEISQTGQIGCGECYQTFRAQLLPVIQRIHGAARHKGKSPGGSALRVSDPNHQMVASPRQEKPAEAELREKERLMQEAIQLQDFENAALLRDQIKELKAKNGLE
ncbi:hypothetical protein D7X94_12425 [Acutalibacter sp. 1XD8-33]|uniref:UvrB/UvrC motif-containing protein n=1 Tax=Acutalibacter sp. 1XD8-33 TaxID=2320081 RepID=UPI000EA2ED2B|nr:UvrB/UvrC motif-containing protein [Acutalibacter sp. 1XD8-33]RKJ39444.1 hypothetical protein D7X94_12425 [Acutalibacter sp. 1XD8-33]